MRKVSEIIVHCSATRPEWMYTDPIKAKVKEIRKWHKDRGWKDIGYHYVIDRDGLCSNGRPMDQTGAHTKGHNKGTIGVCLIGGHGASKDDSFEDHFTEAQDKSLRNLIKDLEATYGHMKVSGHNEYANKGCPGFNVRQWLEKHKGGGIWVILMNILSSLMKRFDK